MDSPTTTGAELVLYKYAVKGGGVMDGIRFYIGITKTVWLFAPCKDAVPQHIAEYIDQLLGDGSTPITIVCIGTEFELAPANQEVSREAD